MRYPRIYIDTSLSIGTDLTLPQDAAKHIATVLRKKHSQMLHVFNGVGGYYLAEIMSTDKRCVLVKIQEFFGEDCESPLHITLAQGVSRGQHMDYTIQKAVELGVKRIVPVLTEHSNVRLDDQRKQKRLEHWSKVIISACEQCGRNFLPELTEPMTIFEWFATDESSLKLILESTSSEALGRLSPSEEKISILSGPEGGFSDAEVEAARANSFQAVKLGPRVLRTETASVAALSAIQTLWGDMG